MNNTTFTAKNTWADGLVMDFSPDNTQATTLTSALNATLLTFNGNEMALQNDMGNGRVETAYLPEGYIPVGTCEFGDIIYIVSYNPLTNKSQIGCFPSPERNISSDEVGDTAAEFVNADFIEYKKFDDNSWGNVVKADSVKKEIFSKPLNPGDKFIVYTNPTRLASNSNVITDCGNTDQVLEAFPKQVKFSVVAIEDSGKINYLNSDLVWYDDYYINTSKEGQDGTPDIDTYRNLLKSGYSIFQSKVSGKLAILAELERIDTFSCTYEVEKRKSATVNNNVAYDNYVLLLNYNWETKDGNINPQKIKIKDVSWVSNADPNKAGTWSTWGTSAPKATKLAVPTLESAINVTAPTTDFYDRSDYSKFKTYNYLAQTKDISVTRLTQARYVKDPTNLNVPVGAINIGYYYEDLAQIVDGTYYDLGGIAIEGPKQYSDVIVNNYFKQSVYGKLTKDISGREGVIQIPREQTITKDGVTEVLPINRKDLILKFTAIPEMEYGMLTDLSKTCYIDFSKVGTGTIKLNGYKYYIGQNLCTLSLQTEVYPEDNKGVEEIVLEFYDNQGPCATYHINNRGSYSGNIMEQIPLNGESSSYKLSDKGLDGNQLVHAGVKDDNGTVGLIDGIPTSDPKKLEDYKGDWYQNDAGTLYSNMLYAVKIVFKYTTKNVLGQYDSTYTSEYVTEWRWLWTNTMFNDYYYTVEDFKNNQFVLDLDTSAQYYANYEYNKRTDYYNPNKILPGDNSYALFKNYAANIQNLDGIINFTQNIGLQDTYNMFSLYGEITADNKNYGVYADNQLTRKLYLGHSYISYNNKQLKSTTADNVDTTAIEPASTSTYEPDYFKDILKGDLTSPNNIWEGSDTYTNFKDQMEMTLTTDDSKLSQEQLVYIDSQQQERDEKLPYVELTGNLENKYNLYIHLWNFNKYIQIYNSTIKNVPVIRPVLYKDTANSLGFYYDTSSKRYKLSNIYTLKVGRDQGGRSSTDKHMWMAKWKSLDAVPSEFYDYTVMTQSGNINSNIKDKVEGVYVAHGGGENNRTFSQYRNQKYRYFLDGMDEGSTDVYNLSLYLQSNQFFLHVIDYYPQKWGGHLGISKSNAPLKNSDGNDLTLPSTLLRNGHAVLCQPGYVDQSGIHLLNDYSNIATVNSSGYSSVNCEYALVQALLHTYRVYENQQINVINLYNQVAYDYVTSYTQDLIYKVTLKNDNSNILIHGRKYGGDDGYLSKLLNTIKDLHKDVTIPITATDSNVKVQFGDVVKNVPIQVQINALLPSFVQEDKNYKFEGWEKEPIVQTLDINTLYYIDSNNYLIPVNSQQYCKQLLPQGEEFNSEVKEGTIGFYALTSNVFNVRDGMLQAKRTSPITGYAQVGYEWSSKTGGALVDLQIGDLMLKDCFHVS